MHFLTRRWVVACIMTAAACLAFPVAAGTIGLAWNASAGAAGYNVYYGASPGSYTTIINVGNVTEITFNDVPDCTKWYFAVTAYNAAGESGFSNEVGSLPRPYITSAGSIRQGEQTLLTVSGANFEPDAVFELEEDARTSYCPGGGHACSNPVELLHVDTDNYTFVDCREVEMLATAAPTAPGEKAAEAGKYALRVTRTDGLWGRNAQALEVTVNPARFDIATATDDTNGRLDGSDLVRLARYFGQCDPDRVERTPACDSVDPDPYDPDVDFDGDGWIEGNELLLLGSNWGRCWNGTTWSAQACAGR